MPDPGTWDQLLNITQARLQAGAGAEKRKLPLDRLVPNPGQPRKFFEATALEELATSIKTHGVLQPLLVRPHPKDTGHWQIVAGERRWLAANQAGLLEVPVLVRELDDQAALELGLVENVLREDITPMEEARALKALLDATGWSYATLGERLGKNKAWVDHRVRLLRLPAVFQDALEQQVAGAEGKTHRPFTPRHASVVIQAPEEAQAGLIDEILREGVSVAHVDARVKALVKAAAPAGRPVRRKTAALGTSSRRVAADSLQTFVLFMNQRAEDGTVCVEALRAALEADRRALEGY
ncbi:MAG: ParB/RepB/Spo0J family partition protein [Candidatus Sericytochromatia bacterium]|nr:ParB/RepB/Spo0J family partition protein [Candidatus Sericytochromatia bacterium]